MVHTSSFGRAGIVALIVASIAASGVVVPTATAGFLDAGDTKEQATEIDTQSTVTGSITPSDVDWYAVELEAGRGVTVQFQPESGRRDVLTAVLYTPDGARVRSPAGSDQTTSATVVERSGTYYVKVAADTKQTGSVSYELSIASPALDQHDPNERRSQAVSVTPDKLVRGVMTGYDREYFAVNGTAGDTLSVETTVNGESIDRVVVYGPSGKRVHSSSGRNVSGVRLPNDGVYTIQFVSDLGVAESIGYTFRVRMTPKQSGGPHRITPGETVRGTTRSTANTYTVDLTKGNGFTVLLTQPRDNRTSLSFSITDPSGVEVGAISAKSRGVHNKSSETAVNGAVATQTGPYTISVSGAQNTNYSLTVQTDTLETHEPNDRLSTATSLTHNTTTAGVLTGYDRDVYAIDLRAGQTATVASTGTGGFKSVLWVAGPNTTARSHSSRATAFGSDTITGATLGNRLRFTANQSGTYYIKAVPHSDASTPATFFKSVSYELTASVSNGVTVLNISTVESKTTTPSTATARDTTTSTQHTTTQHTTTQNMTTQHAPTTNRSSASAMALPETNGPAIGVGVGALAAIGGVVVVFVSVGMFEWWHQSREEWDQ